MSRFEPGFGRMGGWLFAGGNFAGFMKKFHLFSFAGVAVVWQHCRSRYGQQFGTQNRPERETVITD
jgi:hypothetical protein